MNAKDVCVHIRHMLCVVYIACTSNSDSSVHSAFQCITQTATYISCFLSHSGAKKTKNVSCGLCYALKSTVHRAV